MKNYCIIHNEDPVSNEIAERLNEQLQEYRFQYDEKHPDLIIVVGGDGKFLRTVHEHMEDLTKIHFVVINTGTLGFVSDFEEDEVDILVKSIVADDYKLDLCRLIKADIVKKDGSTVTEYALNEFRIENPMNTLIVDIHVDDEYFEEFSGNGLCISTQFGSSAYNRSLSGAIIAPGVEVLQITEIAGIHNNKYSSLSNSLIVPGSAQVTITPKSINNVILGLDSLHIQVDNYQKINLTLSDKQVQFARYRKYSYYERLHHSFIV